MFRDVSDAHCTCFLMPGYVFCMYVCVDENDLWKSLSVWRVEIDPNTQKHWQVWNRFNQIFFHYLTIIRKKKIMWHLQHIFKGTYLVLLISNVINVPKIMEWNITKENISAIHHWFVLNIAMQINNVTTVYMGIYNLYLSILNWNWNKKDTTV